MLEVSAVGRFQNRICIASIISSASQENKSKIACIAMKKWDKPKVTLDNSRLLLGSNTKIVQENES